MFRKQECVAMLLAGGQGSRLYALTQQYRQAGGSLWRKIPDHRFSALQLHQFGHRDGGGADAVPAAGCSTTILDPASRGILDRMDARCPRAAALSAQQAAADWYKGTANAIYQNMAFIERYDPEYVLVLSGDHIYKMDYSKMIAVPQGETTRTAPSRLSRCEMSEASRFGILNTHDGRHDLRVRRKAAKEPKSNLASMGIYVFNWEKLRDYLTDDEQDPRSQNDFGKNVLPAMLAAGERMFAYRFEGYWKDVGTIDSLWEANMDLLNPKVPLDLSDPEWKIYSRNPGLPPHYIGRGRQRCRTA